MLRAWVQLQGPSRHCSQHITPFSSTSWIPVREWLGCSHLILLSALRHKAKSARPVWDRISSEEKKGIHRALISLSIKSTLELSDSELPFMWNYKSLLSKLHVVWYVITHSPKYPNSYTLVDLSSIIKAIVISMYTPLYPNIYISTISPDRYLILYSLLYVKYIDLNENIIITT